MPKVPSYQRQYSIPSGAGPMIDLKHAGDVGKAMQQFGKTIGEVDESIVKHQELIQKREDNDTFLNMKDEFNNSLRDFQVQELQKTGQDSYENMKRADEFLKQSGEKLLSGLKTSDVQQHAKSYLERESKGLKDRLAVHQAGERRIVSVQAVNNAIDGYAKDALVGEKDFQSLLEGFYSDVNLKIEDGSLNLRDAEDLGIRGEQKIAASMIDGLMTRNPAKALEVINSGEMNRYLSPERLKQFQEKATALKNDSNRAVSMTLIDELGKKAAISPEDRDAAIKDLDKNPLLGFSEQERVKLRQAFKEYASVNEIARRVNEKDFQGTLADLKKTDENGAPTYLPDLDPKDREHFIGSIQSAIETERRRQEAEKKAAYREWKQDIRERLSSYKDDQFSGMPVDAKEEAALWRAVKGTEFERKFNAIKEKGESWGERMKKLNDDPLINGAAMLGMQVKPVNASNAQTLTESIQGNLSTGRRVQAAFNLPYVPVLDKEAALQLPRLLEKQEHGSIDTVKQLTNALGRDVMLSISQQIAAHNRDNALTAAVIGAVATGDQNIAYMLIDGQKYLKTDSIKKPKDDDLRAAFDRYLGNAFENNSAMRDIYYDTFKAYYIGGAVNKGLTDGSLNNKLAETAVRATVGDIVKVNGNKTILPQGYTESSFINSVRQITPQIIDEMGGVQGMDSKVASEIIMNYGRFIKVAEGIYRVEIRNGAYLNALNTKGIVGPEGLKDFIQLRTKDGKLVQFDFRRK